MEIFLRFLRLTVQCRWREKKKIWKLNKIKEEKRKNGYCSSEMNDYATLYSFLLYDISFVKNSF